VADGYSDEDIVSQGGEREPRFRVPGWRPPRAAAILAAVTLVVGVGAGYSVGRQQGGRGAASSAGAQSTASGSPANASGASPSAAPTPSQSALNQLTFGGGPDAPPLTQEPGSCSAPAGKDFEVGVPVTNTSQQAISLRDITPVLPLRGLLSVLSWQWNPCGYNGAGTTWEVSGITEGSPSLEPGQNAWLTATVKPLVRCPAAAPLQFRVAYTAGNDTATATLPGFSDLTSVKFPGCSGEG
jgi:hypothetical protein